MGHKLAFLVRVSLGVIFTVSGASKLSDPQSFSTAIQNFGIIPNSWVGAFVFSIPVLELISGVLLSIGYCIRISSAVVIGLLIIFIDVIIPNLAIGNVVECDCFGSLVRSQVDIVLLVRDIFMLCLGVIVYGQSNHILALDNTIMNKGTA